MTKQEYESSTAIIMADKKLGHTNRMTELRYIDAEYIASLEAEVARLNRALDVAAETLNHIACGCPKDECDTCVVSWECTHKTVMNYADCWREYALAEALKMKGGENGKD